MNINLPKLIRLSVLLSLMLVIGQSSGQLLKNVSSAASDSEPRQKYHLKFLTPNTVYPVRLKDHFGKKGNTRWYKHNSQGFIDEIALSSKFYSTETDDYNEGDKAVHLLILKSDPQTRFILDNYEPKRQESILKNSNIIYDYEYSFENSLGILF